MAQSVHATWRRVHATWRRVHATWRRVHATWRGSARRPPVGHGDARFRPLYPYLYGGGGEGPAVRPPVGYRPPSRDPRPLDSDAPDADLTACSRALDVLDPAPPAHPAPIAGPRSLVRA